ncbi:DYRK-family kinase pom1 [Hyphodiscus hymeniophilus]|uniref:DYRK-family kinase pom1 n=1 Tax=Hyphodiscus hymeniophilus TaxID=353542 RepID=A0A9P7B0Z4_9HELO|nr:DYRK-family kinase pom1 [Hyphodiscus hymeniophilus]
MEASNEVRATAGTRVVSGPRPARAGSILRRQSTSTRQSSISSTTSAASGNMDPPSGPLAARNRRQSQYPPISGGGIAVGAKAPRKSIGPGMVDSEYSRPSQKRRPSLASSTTSNQGLSDSGGVSTRVNIGGTPTYTDGARGLTASRAAKTKSLQPPSRQGQTHLTPKTNTPDHSRSLSFAGKSPSRPNGKGANTPSSSSKRMSVMPGTQQGNHATGLGARTISPTDARRAKRLSILQQPPPMPQTPPTGHPDKPIRNSSRSPSMLPRKITTPSSSRTTPDVNRKSYSSGISIGSNASYNTSRTSTGSLQPRLSQQPPTSSRLPTPKPRNVHSSADNNEEEEVPPVPAIPKAYESPKDSPSEPPFFTKRKSSMPFDASSINSTSTNSLSGGNSIREPAKAEREHKPRQYGPAVSNSDDQQNNATPIKKKNLQPLRLPPLNLLPLSTPTVAKIAAMAPRPVFSDGQITPPPRRANAKTPSTPMTASKTSFFSRNRTEDKTEQNLQHLRSSSSIHHLRSESSSEVAGSSSESSKPIAMNMRAPRQTVSPFISNSLPKNGGEHSFMSRSKTTSDLMTADPAPEHRPTRLTGPRAQKVAKTPKNEDPSQISSPEEPTTPSSGSSLRRKLSLGWKRSTSKSNINISHAANERGSEYAPQPPKHDNMPPPKLPTSATLNSLNNFSVPSPSPSIKSTTYLDSKRRKSSASSLSVFGHDRTRSDSWGLNGSPKKDHPIESKSQRPLPSSRSTSSVMHKMLSSKNSTSNMKAADPYTIDLDKDDLLAEEEMKRLGSKRKETEIAAHKLDALRKRAVPRDRISSQYAIGTIDLNIYEKGEIVDFQDIYFCGTPDADKHVGELSVTTTNFGYDDERGDYTIVPGDHLYYRYEIVDVLGKGSFGQVVRCVDHKTGALVAIKIIRNKKRFHQQALVEVNILRKLREWDPLNKHSMINFVQSFYFRGHLCISTELLDMNLYELIKSNSFRGFSLKVVRRFTKQLLSSLLLLKQHRVIHCDLKPENILLAHPLHSEIKVIDFGSSCFENEKVYTYIQSRFYRSPEVILGMTYGIPIDMWSVGCILAELFTGVPIFPGENENEQLACIMEIFGPPEKHLIEKATRRKVFFDSLGKPRLQVSTKGKRRRPSSKTLQQVLKCDDETFIDFLTRCLRWDPDRRMKPEEAIRHEFVTGQKSSMASARATARNPSPMKRNNTVATPSANNRPLPEPPITAMKNMGLAPRGTVLNGTTSPSKSSLNLANAGASSASASASARRVSNANSLNNNNSAVNNNNRRTSTGPSIAASGGSGLPRVTRSVSARQQDLASAGAHAAMSKRV